MGGFPPDTSTALKPKYQLTMWHNIIQPAKVVQQKATFHKKSTRIQKANVPDYVSSKSDKIFQKESISSKPSLKSVSLVKHV